MWTVPDTITAKRFWVPHPCDFQGCEFSPAKLDKDVAENVAKMNGKDVEQQTDRLDGALEPNTAFFVQFYHEDYSKTGSETEEPEHE